MKRTYLLATIFFGVLCIITMFKPGSAAIDYKKNLMPGQFHVEYYEYSNNTDVDAAKRAQTHLVLFREPESIAFSSEKACSLFILNETEMLHFVGGQTFIAKKTWANITAFHEDITYQKLVGEYKVETYLFNSTGGEPTMYASMYFAVRNEVNDSNYFSLRVGYKNGFIIFIDDLFRIIVTAVFIYFGLRLHLDARRAREENQASKTHIYKNYGIGFYFGGITTLVWEIYHWYARIEPSESWVQPLRLDAMPDIPIFSKNILSFVTFVSLGFSIMFMSNTVERMVQNKKITLFTYILLIMELVMVGCIFIPEILIIMLYPWIGALIIASANILITYIKVARITTGGIRQQAISIFLYLILLYLSISLVRILVVPEFVGNILSTIFIVGLYNSLKMAREIRKQEAMQGS